MEDTDNNISWLRPGIKMSVASSIFLILPTYLQTLAHQFNASAFDLGYLATVEIMGFALASLVSFIAAKTKLIKIREEVAILTLAVLHVASAYCDNLSIFLTLRVFAGISAGIVIVRSFEVLSKTPVPDAAFGKAIALQMLYSASLFLLLPCLTNTFGVESLYLLLGTLSATLLLLPMELDTPFQPMDTIASSNKTLLIAGLSAIFMIMLTHAGAWSQLSLIATSLDINNQAQGNILAFGTICSLFGALLASLVATHHFKRQFIFIAAAAQALTFLQLFNTNNLVIYIICVSLFMLLWNFLLPLFMGAVSGEDTDGGGIRFAVAAQTIGAAMGPSILLKGWVLLELLIFLTLTLILISPLLPPKIGFTK